MPAIPASVTNLFKNPKKLVVRGVGLAALGLIGYDAHYIGKIKADTYSSERDADASLYYLNNSMYSTNMSKVEDNIREGVFGIELNQGWRRFFNEGIGYVKGFTGMLVNHVVPLGLGIAALCGKKFGAIGLGIVGAYKLVRNVFGYSTPNGLTK